MRKILIILLLLFVCHYAGNSQQQAKDWGAFMKKINVREFSGKKFRIEAAVKVTLIDTTADAELWVRVDRLNEKMGFFYNMMDKPIRSAEWKTYTINGKIAKDAQYLVFGGLYHRRGIFYYDNFKLFIEKEKGNFEEIKLIGNDFEIPKDSLPKQWGYLKDRPSIQISITEKDFFEGSQGLMVDASAFKPEKTFGYNDSTGKYARANGINIYYEVYGQGEPLLLLHGNSSSISLFEKQIPELSKHYKVIAVDTRGQGKSSDDGRLYTYDLFADDMNALLDYLHLDSVNILGWSDGGNTGLIMALKYPAKVKKLVTMGANIFIDNTVVAKWVFKTLNKEKKVLENDTLYDSRNRLRLINLLLTEPKHSFTELKTIKCPVLIIAGEKDVIKEGHTKQIAAAITTSTLFIAPKETHYFPSENPALFNKTVLDFLKKAD